MNATTASALRRRSSVLLLALVFLLPLAAAFYLYYGPLPWRPAHSVNHGALIDPARPLPAVGLPTIDGGVLAEDFLRHRWTLIYVGRGDCDERCHDALYQIRQVRLALNSDMDRVQRLFIAAEPCCDRGFLSREHNGLVVVRAATPATGSLLAVFPDDTGPVTGAGRIYIADPLGNLMMVHPRDSNPKYLLEDLKRLLKLSQIG
jgi:cytochrome oxidase Cu insertion factor (SCO1/SenC/PrrC family)